MSEKACVTCTRLSKCKDATAEMVLEDGFCPLWELASEGAINARRRMIADFGPTAVLQNPIPPKKDEEDMAIARRTLLRKLALAIGAIEKNPKTFMLQAEALTEILKENYEDIEDMSDEDLEALIDEIKGGEEPEEEPAKKAPAKKSSTASKGRGRGRGRSAKKEEPEETEEEETEEEVEEEKPKRGRGRGRGASKTAAKSGTSRGRGRGSKAKKDEEEPEEEASEEKEEPKKPARGRGRGRGRGSAAKTSAAKKTAAKKEGAPAEAPTPSVDLSEVIERLDTIGPIAAKGKAAGEKALELVENLQKDIDTIVDYLTWQYNETLYDEDGDLLGDDAEPIDSIRDADWTD